MDKALTLRAKELQIEQELNGTWVHNQGFARNEEIRVELRIIQVRIIRPSQKGKIRNISDGNPTLSDQDWKKILENTEWTDYQRSVLLKLKAEKNSPLDQKLILAIYPKFTTETMNNRLRPKKLPYRLTIVPREQAPMDLLSPGKTYIRIYKIN